MRRSPLTLPLAAVLLLISLGLYAAHRAQEGPQPESLTVEGTELALAGPGFSEAPAAQLALYTQALERLEERLALYPGDYEASLLKALLAFRTGRVAAAQAELEQLTRRAPRFHLAHLVRGDLLLARTQPVRDIGQGPLVAGIPGGSGPLDELRAEAEVRLRAYLDGLPQGRLPRALLELDAATRTAVVVDKAHHRLYVYEWQEGEPQLIRDFYVSTGKLTGNKRVRGDKRTPEGVYFITRHIPDRELPPRYGHGAYPLDYPNALDRRLGKTGDGIWLHGTENAFYSRPPQDSDGCVVLPNIDLDAVARYLRPGRTPLIVSERVDWVEPDRWRRMRSEVRSAVEQWRADWESGDLEAYLAHYAEGFWSGRHDRKSWDAYKRRVAAGKEFQEIEIENLSLFAYPRAAADGREMVVATFRQRYRSNNFSSEMTKRLYLTREGGRWKVLYEGRG